MVSDFGLRNSLNNLHAEIKRGHTRIDKIRLSVHGFLATQAMIRSEGGRNLETGENQEEYMNKARREVANSVRARLFSDAASIAMQDARLPPLHSTVADPEIDLRELQRWCVEAMRVINKPAAQPQPPPRPEPSTNVIPKLATAKPLSPLQKLAFAIIKPHTMDNSISGVQIVESLQKLHRRTTSIPTLTRHIIPALKPRGVKSRRKGGYWYEAPTK